MCSFSWILGYRCITLLRCDSPDGNISKEDRDTLLWLKLLANSRAASAYLSFIRDKSHLLQIQMFSSLPAETGRVGVTRSLHAYYRIMSLTDCLSTIVNRYRRNKRTKSGVGGTTSKQNGFQRSCLLWSLQAFILLASLENITLPAYQAKNVGSTSLPGFWVVCFMVRPAGGATPVNSPSLQVHLISCAGHIPLLNNA